MHRRPIAQPDAADCASVDVDAVETRPPQIDPVRPVAIAEKRSDLRAEHARKRRARIDHRDVNAHGERGRGHFRPHETRTDDDEAPAGLELPAQAQGILKGAERVDASDERDPGEPPGARAGCDDEDIPAELVAPAKPHRPATGFDPLDAAPEHELDPGFVPPVGGA